jgi:precorrin-6Y C5,15-methyltransferase (decarboxylating)
MDAEDHGLIRENADRFAVANVTPILGRAPEACDELPDPDAVFIAGGGREVTRISEYAYKRLRAGGRLVVNVVSIDHLAELREALSLLPLPPGEGRGEGALSPAPDINVWLINLARTTNQLDRLSFDPLKPSFLLAVTKR